jgi:Myb-like DNA-binding domain
VNNIQKMTSSQPQPQVTSKKKTMGRWSKADSKKLKNIVEKIGTSSWTFIANQMSDRTSQQCRSHWFYTLAPGVKHTRWTTQEDDQLRKLVQENGSNWRMIASKLPGRINSQCRQRWVYSLKSGAKKKRWAKSENQQLIKRVEKIGTVDWKEVTAAFPDRVNKQYAARWTYFSKKKELIGNSPMPLINLHERIRTVVGKPSYALDFILNP